MTRENLNSKAEPGKAEALLVTAYLCLFAASSAFTVYYVARILASTLNAFGPSAVAGL